jgi:hypothetical protein
VLVVLAVANAIAWVKKLLLVACVIAWGLACFKIKEFKKVMSRFWWIFWQKFIEITSLLRYISFCIIF